MKKYIKEGEDRMKKSKMLMAVCMIATLMTGCSRTCKIEGCKKEVYKEGLCQTHYYVNQGADAIGSAVSGVLDLLK